MRRPEEVLIVVQRPGSVGREFLVLERAPERQGYWHLVAGALDEGEDAASAAARELREETRLEAHVEDLGLRYRYSLDEEPPEVRARFAPDVAEIAISAFVAEAAPGWEPSLDEEHVSYRWCTATDAIALLRYPEPQDAVDKVAGRLEEAEA
jgi:8-oxo-dGTP pyrophosphatase MutT (NUDIX family)